ncbi:hypothetical protein E0Z10_g2530 [Xylaria hypoxylon]|uniref:SMP-30/Gluconolactonase/LRE-like region domain-containing protein n=1 Tax=Xylaria hypoxylon TaxID=37992 RepID=A0A4Z0YPG6_9PEZI|nr:hypothetical protein E0Z10_g2530 [Xylaria hypoxylon]
MASVSKDNIKIQTASIKAVDLLGEAQTGAESESSINSDNLESITIKMFHSSFSSVIGDTCTFSLLLSADSSQSPFFHKGSSTPSTPVASIEWMKLRPPPNMPMPSGVVPYKKGLLYCSQGTLEPNSGGLFYMPLGKRPVPLVTNYFGKAFNSAQSVVEDKVGGLWFTDSCAGLEQEIRPRPQLPNHVYWFHPTTGELRVVADGLKRPGGIALSPNEDTLYITDTEAARPGNTAASTSSATIYAYDIPRRQGASPFLVNKRLFAFAFSGVPAAVTCDPAGNVYAACADGVEVWNSGGTALGLIQIPDSENRAATTIDITIKMNQYITGIASRLAEPQAGINALWEICNGRVGLIEGLQNWQPPTDAPSLLFYLAVTPAFLVHLLFTSMGAFLGRIASSLYHDILEIFIRAILTLRSFLLANLIVWLSKEAFMLLGVPRGALSVQFLEGMLRPFVYVHSMVYAVAKIKGKRILIKRFIQQEMVWLSLFAMFLGPIYIMTMRWSMEWRWTTLVSVASALFRAVLEIKAQDEQRVMAWIIAEIQRNYPENELDNSECDTLPPSYHDDYQPPPYIANDDNTWDDIDFHGRHPPIRCLRSSLPRYRRARRLPRPLMESRSFRDPSDTGPNFLLRYYITRLEARIYRRVREEYQVEFIAHRILTTRSEDEIWRSIHYPSFIERYIDEAIHFAAEVNPQLFALFNHIPPSQGTTSIGSHTGGYDSESGCSVD